MSTKAGKSARLYRNANADGSGTYHEVDCREVTFQLQHTLADVTLRSHNFQRQLPVLSTLTVTITLLYDPTDAQQAALFNALWAAQPVWLRILDGPNTTGSKGIEGPFILQSWDKQEPLTEAQAVTIQAVPAPSGPDPAPVTVT